MSECCGKKDWAEPCDPCPDITPETLEFPRYCANNCGRTLNKPEEAQRVKYTRNLDGASWFDWVCKRDCQPERALDPGPAM